MAKEIEMLIQITTGDENFREGTAKYHVFAVPSARFAGIAKEAHVGVLSAAGIENVRRVSANRIPAATGSVDMGAWTTATYDVPDGIVLKLWGQRTMSAQSLGSNRGAKDMGAMILQPRAEAALRRIQCTQVGAAKANVRSVTVEGRFDILSLREAMEAGARLPMEHLSQFHSAGIPRLFRVTTIDPEISGRAQLRTTVIQGDKGEQVRVTTATRRRAVDLD